MEERFWKKSLFWEWLLLSLEWGWVWLFWWRRRREGRRRGRLRWDLGLRSRRLTWLVLAGWSALLVSSKEEDSHLPGCPFFSWGLDRDFRLWDVIGIFLDLTFIFLDRRFLCLLCSFGLRIQLMAHEDPRQLGTHRLGLAFEIFRFSLNLRLDFVPTFLPFSIFILFAIVLRSIILLHIL